MSNFTLKRERSDELCRIFKSVRELLVSACMSLAERLRLLVSCLRVHDYCTSAKYLRAFGHGARTQALASSVNVCHETDSYVSMLT